MTDRYSDRHGYHADERDITIREDAPEDLRFAIPLIAQDAAFNGMVRVRANSHRSSPQIMEYRNQVEKRRKDATFYYFALDSNMLATRLVIVSVAFRK